MEGRLKRKFSGYQGVRVFIANVIMGLHIGLFFLVAVVVVLTAFNKVCSNKITRYLLWAVSALSLGWAILPIPCVLSKVEVWFRRQVYPEWQPAHGLPQTVVLRITGKVISDNYLILLGTILLFLLLYGAVKYEWRTEKKK